MKRIIIYTLFIISFLSLSCESEQNRKIRIQREELNRIELAEKQKADELRIAEEKKLQQIERDAQLEKERQEKAIYDQFINNSLRNGATPYSYCYGGNGSCSNYGCSQISVKTPYNSDVLVTIKRNDEVVRHAYITAGSTYTFEVSNGTYQPFFYYGKGWNPEKFMKNSSCGVIKGGFISDESFGKDEPQTLNNNTLSYELILQENGNFSTSPSNQNDAL